MIKIIMRAWAMLNERAEIDLNWVSGSLPENDTIVAIDRGNSFYEQGACEDGQWSLVEAGMWGFIMEGIDPPIRWRYE